MNSRVGSRATHAPAEFTAHAAVHLKRHYRNSPFRVHDDTARPLLDNINKIGYERLEHIVHKTFPKCDIINIHRVNAPQIYGMYLLRKEEMRLANGGYDAQELVLYHVTAKSRALESLKNGLDWRLTKRAKFGCGVSFSNDGDYGNYYANRSSNEGVRVIVMSTVLINDTPYLVTEKLDRKNRLIIPPGTADTTVSPNGYVFVKYTDFESYPLFFIYYRWTPELFNESKYFNTITNNNNNNKKKKNNSNSNNNNNNNNHLQRLQQEDTLCRQVANLLIGESSSQHVAAKAAATKPPCQSKNATKKRRDRRRRPAAKLAEANANDPQPKPTLSDQNFKQATPPRRSRRSRRASKQRRRSLSRRSKMMIEVPFDYYM